MSAGHLRAYTTLVYSLLPSSVPFDLFEMVIRKTAHLFEYAVWAILLCFASRSIQLPLRTALVIAICGAALTATIDELHQSHVVGRVGSPVDIFLDTVGACLGLSLALKFRLMK